MFIDTGAFYALADRRDPAHESAKAFYTTEKRPFLTTDFVFAETMSLITKRLGKAIAVRFGDGIRRSSRIRVEDVPPEVRELGWALFSSRLDKDYDLIDCISFAMMDAIGLREAFGFDRHFRQHGLQLFPPPER